MHTGPSRSNLKVTIAEVGYANGSKILNVAMLRTRAYSHAVPPKVGFMGDTSSSPWRTAYFSAIFETDPAKLTLNIADARAAITERLNSPIEISRLEHEAI